MAEYANKCTTYKLTGINHVTKSTQAMAMMPTTHSPITYTELVTWQNQSKEEKKRLTIQTDAWNRCAVVNTDAQMGCADDIL